MRRGSLGLLLLVGILSGCNDSNSNDDGGEAPPPPAPEPPANTVDFDVTLSPAQVIGGGAADGSGDAQVTVNLDDGAISGTVALTDVDADAVVLAQGFAGESGEVLVPLEEASASEWSFPADAVLSEADRDALQAGGLHILATTADAPEGALRGQLLPEGFQVLRVPLSGTQEVPPVDTPASAEAALTLDGSDNSLVLHLNTAGLEDAAEAHIHEAVAGVNGPILIGLVQDPDDISHWSLDDFVLEQAALDALNAGGLYVNVHTPDHPAGEVRGQVEPDDVDVFIATLTGDEVDPPVETDASGVAAATLLAASQSLSLHVNLVGLDDAEAVEIRQGGVMQNGPVVVSLEQDPNDLAHWFVEDLALSTAQQEALVNQGLYVSVATPAFPDGELRAQLMPEGSTPGAGETAPTLAELQAEIFTPSCAKSGCHAGSTPAQGMNLSAGQTFANTVGVPSTEVPSLNRIEPSNPDESYLVQKVEGSASVGGRMPLDGPPFLSDAQIQQIRDWIAAGAEDN